MRQEAILSSRIENTYTSYSELVAFETTGGEAASTDTEEVLNYVDALEYGLRVMAHPRISSGTSIVVRELEQLALCDAASVRYRTTSAEAPTIPLTRDTSLHHPNLVPICLQSALFLHR